MDHNQLKRSAAQFLKHLRSGDAWEFRFSSTNESTLIGTTLAAMLAGLTGWLTQLTDSQKRGWANAINAYQQPNGFFSDEDISDKNLAPGYTKERALFHRTRHALFALETLGCRPKYRFEFLGEMLKPRVGALTSVKKWMGDLDLSNYWDEANKIMDLCLFLDHEARVYKNKKAVEGIETILDICDNNTNPQTGYHDRGESELRNAMAGAMHLYPIYFLWGRKPKYPEQVIKTTLSLQQKDGLFGYETGSGGEDCLDYDAVNILVNFSFITGSVTPGFMKKEVRECLERLLGAFEGCVNPDGGFCCHRRAERYRFGTYTTEVLRGGSSLWSTYSRLLTIAMATQVVKDHPAAGEWNLGNNIMEIWNGGMERI